MGSRRLYEYSYRTVHLATAIYRFSITGETIHRSTATFSSHVPQTLLISQ